MNAIEWILIKGGNCDYGDRNKVRSVGSLLWSKYLITTDLLGISKEQNIPISNINLFLANTIAKKFSARLPTSTEWEWMASGEENRVYPWGNSNWDTTKANIKNLSLNKKTPVGIFPNGNTPEGICDVAGNVYEMTSTIIQKNAIIIRGGSYNSNLLHIQNKFINSVPLELGSPGIGIRLVKEVV